MNTQSNEVYGIVLPDQDPLGQGRYKVYIPEKMQRPSGEVKDGIWCQNGMSSFRGFRNSDNQSVVGGSYKPVQPGTPVIISTTGVGNNPSIVRFAQTSISSPDSENRDGLTIIDQTPDGSTIEIDSQKGYMVMNFRDGQGNVMLSQDTISMELNADSGSGKRFISGIQIQPDKIQLAMKDAHMELNSTGFGITLKDGSYFRMSQKGIEMYGEDFINISSKKQCSVLSKQVNINGTSELHLLGSDTKITGTQKVAMNGNQVAIEGFLTTQLKGMHVGMEAKVKMSLKSLMYDNNVLGIKNEYASVSSDTAQSKSCVYTMLAESTSSKLSDAMKISNMGVGASVSGSLSTSTLAATTATQFSLAAFGTILLVDNPATAAANAVIAAAIPGSAQPADEPTGTTFGVKDKTDTTTPTSVLATVINKRNAALKKYSVVPDAMAQTSRSLSYTYSG